MDPRGLPTLPLDEVETSPTFNTTSKPALSPKPEPTTRRSRVGSAQLPLSFSFSKAKKKKSKNVEVWGSRILALDLHQPSTPASENGSPNDDINLEAIQFLSDGDDEPRHPETKLGSPPTNFVSASSVTPHGVFETSTIPQPIMATIRATAATTTSTQEQESNASVSTESIQPFQVENPTSLELHKHNSSNSNAKAENDTHSLEQNKCIDDSLSPNTGRTTTTTTTTSSTTTTTRSTLCLKPEHGLLFIPTAALNVMPVCQDNGTEELPIVTTTPPTPREASTSTTSTVATSTARTPAPTSPSQTNQTFINHQNCTTFISTSTSQTLQNTPATPTSAERTQSPESTSTPTPAQNHQPSPDVSPPSTPLTINLVLPLGSSMTSKGSGTSSGSEDGSDVELDLPVSFQMLYRSRRGTDSVVDHLRSMQRTRHAEFKKCIREFNTNSKKGLAMLESENFMTLTVENVASFLYEMDGLSRKQVGEYLGKHEDVLKKYTSLFDFTNMHIDDALRVFLVGFQLPGEAQIIDRFMEGFAQRYVQCNPTGPLTAATAYVLSFSIIMLNTDLHSPNVRNKMSLQQFLRNCRGIDESNSIPVEFLSQMYDRIAENELKFKVAEENMTVFCSPEKQGWLLKEGGRIKTRHRRWFILKDECLYYFESPEEDTPKGTIPLEPRLQVRCVSSNKYPHQFELSMIDNMSTIKSSKRTQDGAIIVGQHSSFVFQAESESDLLSWTQKIEAAIITQRNRLVLSRKLSRSNMIAPVIPHTPPSTTATQNTSSSPSSPSASNSTLTPTSLQKQPSLSKSNISPARSHVIPLQAVLEENNVDLDDADCTATSNNKNINRNSGSSTASNSNSLHDTNTNKSNSSSNSNITRSGDGKGFKSSLSHILPSLHPHSQQGRSNTASSSE